MKQIIIFTIVISLISFKLNAQVENDTLIFGLKNTKIFKESIFYELNYVEYYTPKHIKSKIKPTFMIRSESQVGISIRPSVVKSNSYASRFETEMFIEDMVGKNFLQIGEYDFDNDKISELVIAFGVRGTGLLCFIYKYHEPANIVDADRDENWEQIGTFEYGYSDPKYISFVEKSKIYFPVGSQGYSEGFIYVDNKFVKFQ